MHGHFGTGIVRDDERSHAAARCEEGQSDVRRSVAGAVKTTPCARAGHESSDGSFDREEHERPQTLIRAVMGEPRIGPTIRAENGAFAQSGGDREGGGRHSRARGNSRDHGRPAAAASPKPEAFACSAIAQARRRSSYAFAIGRSHAATRNRRFAAKDFSSACRLASFSFSFNRSCVYVAFVASGKQTCTGRHKQ